VHEKHAGSWVSLRLERVGKSASLDNGSAHHFPERLRWAHGQMESSSFPAPGTYDYSFGLSGRGRVGLSVGCDEPMIEGVGDAFRVLPAGGNQAARGSKPPALKLPRVATEI
jgi:hypothetical protein